MPCGFFLCKMVFKKESESIYCILIHKGVYLFTPNGKSFDVVEIERDYI